MNYEFFRQRYFDYSDGSRNSEFDRNDWNVIDVSFFQKTSKFMEGIME